MLWVIGWIVIGLISVAICVLVNDERVVLIPKTYGDLAHMLAMIVFFSIVGVLGLVIAILYSMENHKWQERPLPWVKKNKE